MDRMTYKAQGNCGFVWALRTADLQNGIDRLAAYEDTGLEPEEIEDLKQMWDMYGGEEGITAMLTPHPNPPLTLEELWGMGGEPYWHVGLQKDSPPPHWNILDPLYARHIENYGYEERWLAYRRKPTEFETQEGTSS